MRYFVNGAGFVFESPINGAVMVPHGVVFDPGPAGAPAGWVPPPDSWNLFPMDTEALSALEASIAAEIARNGGSTVPPPGIVQLAPPTIFAP
jgi:hypothetical protein